MQVTSPKRSLPQRQNASCSAHSLGTAFNGHAENVSEPELGAWQSGDALFCIDQLSPPCAHRSDEFWAWMSQVLLPSLYNNQSGRGSYSTMLGVPRLRQLRLREGAWLPGSLPAGTPWFLLGSNGISQKRSLSLRWGGFSAGTKLRWGSSFLAPW